MNFLTRLFKRNPVPKNSASLAKERLQIIISHERMKQQDDENFLPQLQKELVEVIAKYVHIDPDDVKVDLDNSTGHAVLELNVVIPEGKLKKPEEETTEAIVEKIVETETKEAVVTA